MRKAPLLMLAIAGLILSLGIGQLFANMDKTEAASVAEESKPQACRVAIVIDDIGYNQFDEELLFSLPNTITLSILPSVPYSTYFADKAKTEGYDAILHLPMEPEGEEARPGAGVITTAMSDDEIRQTIQEDLDTVPGVVGVSNHMGSRATQDIHLMSVVLNFLKSKNLFFLDSITSPETVGVKIARKIGIPVAERNVFLDNEDDPQYIRGQFQELVDVARYRGQAVGIGHYRLNTLEVLQSLIPEYEKQGVIFVRLKELVG